MCIDMIDDYTFESQLKNVLTNRKDFHPAGYLSADDAACSLPSYSTANALEIPMPQRGCVELDLKINSLSGTGDYVWWIVGTQAGNVKHLFRMGGKTRPRIKEAACVSPKNLVLNFSHADRYTVF